MEEQLSTQIEINQKQAAMIEAKKIWKRAIKKEVQEKVELLKQQQEQIGMFQREVDEKSKVLAIKSN